jgi:ribonuclease E
MPKRMLIDASHPEETRVVVLDGQKVEEFDFEAASKRPLKGNIYLAKVTRVEPSLQAAFVEYGGNRQGFLAFSEIHPDYYQIPVADRMALLAEQEAEARRRSDDDVESFDIAPGPKAETSEEEQTGSNSDEAAEEHTEDTVQSLRSEEFDADVSDNDETSSEVAADAAVEGQSVEEPAYENHAAHQDDVGGNAESEEEPETATEEEHEHIEGLVETEAMGSDFVESEDIVAEATASETGEVTFATPAQPLQASRPPQRWMRKRHYKIQEVIKRRQIILVQVVKEERGNKGAALTTYLSLAGRYCVLMPNTPRGGGISRKITNANDRKRLKSAAQALELPEGMGLIIRTAGENRTKVEIKRDYEYLLRMWDTIRELTLKSNAPACVYEEGDLIKRAIRDLYNKDVGEILVEGDEGYRNAKDFMRMLMPSHAKNVKPYREPVPLFQRHHIEAQLDAMFSSTVTLKSGGYIVINQTEALVSIDVNSGRATREHSIEDTARKTNLEAADEIGRQLRLRDLAGLIVIDFIDMEDGRNDRDVEKRMRDAVKNDRARVQIGKISQFGLLEMSRQRLRAGVIAGSTVPCPHCGGQGIMRSVESTALRVLRGLEEEGQKLKAASVMVRVASDVAIYTLNQKRRELARIESDYGMTISFEPKEGLMAGSFEIERTAQKTPEETAKLAATLKTEPAPALVEEDLETVDDVAEETPSQEELPSQLGAQEGTPEQPGAPTSKRRRRRRGGRGHSDRPQVQQTHGQPQQPRQPITQSNAQTVQAPEIPGEATAAAMPANASSTDANVNAASSQPGLPGMSKRKRRRRRGKRGGSSHSSGVPDARHAEANLSYDATSNGYDRFGVPDEIDTTPRNEPARQSAIERSEPEAPVAMPNAASSPVWSLTAGRAEEVASRRHEIVAEPVKKEVLEKTSEPVSTQPGGPPKKGWWQRTFRTDS